MQNEAHLVAALVTHPADIATAAAWLRPEALTDPAWRPVYAALVQLAESGEPIDVVTVNWEVRRASARLGQGPGNRELREAVDSAAASDPGYLGRAVASDQLRTTAAHAADALRSCASSPGIDLVDVLHTGHLLTKALCEKANVLPEQLSGSAPQRHLAAVHDRTQTRDVESQRGVLGPVAG
jgi:replicative DNA helicase